MAIKAITFQFVFFRKIYLSPNCRLHFKIFDQSYLIEVYYSEIILNVLLLARFCSAYTPANGALG